MTYYLTYVFYMAGLSGNIDLISAGVQYALFIGETPLRDTVLTQGAQAAGREWSYANLAIVFSLITFVFIDSKL